MPGLRHGRTMVETRTVSAYQLPRTSGSYRGSKNVCKEQNQTISTTQVGQHISSSSIHKQSGRNNIKDPGCLDSGPVDVVPGTEHTHPSPIPARRTELYSRQGIQVNEGQVRLEAESADLSPNRQALWTTGSRLVRVPANQSVPTLLQLAARSICRGFRCIPAGLVNCEGFCQPSVELYTCTCVLNLAQTQEADLVLVTPLWKAQPWYALLLSLLVDWPRLLPHQELVTPVGKVSVNPLLVVWSISGKASKVKDFQIRLQASLPGHGGPRQHRLTTHSLGDRVKESPIHFRDL